MISTKGRKFRIHVWAVEIYLLTLTYLKSMYRDTRIIETLVAFYIGFALILSFSFFQLGHSAADAISRVSALTLIRLSITVNTMPSFITIFERARKEEIGGMGRNGLVFSPVSVYFAKFIAVSVIRILLFIPFTCIVYPIVQPMEDLKFNNINKIGLHGSFDKVLIFFLVLSMQQAAAISIGLLFSAIFKDRDVAATLITMTSLLTFLFSGSIISRIGTPPSIRWLEFLSISFYANQALIHNEFYGQSFDNGKLLGENFIKDQGNDIVGTWAAIGALAGYTILCNIFGPIALYLTSGSF